MVNASSAQWRHVEELDDEEEGSAPEGGRKKTSALPLYVFW